MKKKKQSPFNEKKTQTQTVRRRLYYVCFLMYRLSFGCETKRECLCVWKQAGEIERVDPAFSRLY